MSRFQDQLIEIARRKERLIARAGSERAVIGASIRQLQGPIGVADRGLEVARFLRAHPLLVVTVIAAVAAFGRRSLISLAGSAISVWRIWRSVSAW
jgi:hypothetical protein